MTTMPGEIRHLYEFGPFHLDPQRRVLTCGADSVALTPKAIETLVVLVENRGRVVSKDELMKSLWPDSFVEESNLSQNIFLLRKALGDSAQERRYILTIPGRGYQFTGTVNEIAQEMEEALVVESHSRSMVVVEREVHQPVWLWASVVVLLLVVIGAGWAWWVSRRGVPSGEREPLVVAEFTNATGDAVFDETLRQTVRSELDRSPTFQIVDDDRMPDLFRAIGQSPDARLTNDLAQKVCVRAKGKFLVEGAIKPQGNGYSIELTALDCAGGRVRSHEQAQSTDINEVLPTVSRLAAATRLRLSGADAKAALDPANLDTSSVQAYKAFLMGYSLMHSQPMQALAMLEKATQVDPQYADAWYFLGIAHHSVGEWQQETEDYKRAFAVREKADRVGRQRIEATYYLEVTGEFHKGLDVLRAWESLDPNQFPPHNLLGMAYGELGEYQKAANEYRQCMSLAPQFPISYWNLAAALEEQGQYDQAAEVLRHAQERKFDGLILHYTLYELALLRSDTAGMEREQAWMARNEDDPTVVRTQARIDILQGHMDRARQRMQHAYKMVMESKLKESAGSMLLTEAAAESLFGESAEARKTLASATKLANSKPDLSGVALAMARNGQSREAKQIMTRLAQENPTDTLLNEVDVPIVLAAWNLQSGHAEQALRELEPTRPYEFGTYATLYPNYLRATAYLQSGRSKEAAAEFQTVVDHRSIRPLSPIWKMSQLGLARAYAKQGDTAKARTAYQDFFGLWKDPDPDLPVLTQAKAEYANLQ